VKSYIGDFHEILPRDSTFGLRSVKNIGNFTLRPKHVSLLLVACVITHCCGTLSIISLLLVACVIKHCCGTLSIISLLLVACAINHCGGTLSIFILLTMTCISTINRAYYYFLIATKATRTRQNVMFNVHSLSILCMF
jgi:hypothetical protein